MVQVAAAARRQLPRRPGAARAVRERTASTPVASGTGATFDNAASEAEQSGMGAGGRGMMPMARGHGQGEKERERSTRLTEDEDIWGDDGDATPPLIG